MVEPKSHTGPADKLIASLQERAKELNCLYEVEQILARLELPLAEAFQQVVEVIPPGWQYPDICRAMIEYGDEVMTNEDFRPTPWVLSSDIVVQEKVVGRLSVWYAEERPTEDSGPFLKEEERLIRTIAERLGHSILFHRMYETRQKWESASKELEAEKELAGPGALYLRMLALGLPFVGLTIGAEQAYTGAGKNTPPMVMHMVSAWGITIPIMYLFGETLGFGPAGMMAGNSLGLALEAMMGVWLVRRGSWLEHRV